MILFHHHSISEFNNSLENGNTLFLLLLLLIFDCFICCFPFTSFVVVVVVDFIPQIYCIFCLNCFLKMTGVSDSNAKTPNSSVDRNEKASDELAIVFNV